VIERIMKTVSFVVVLFASVATAVITAFAQGQPSSGAPFRIEKLDPALDAVISPSATLELLGDRFALTEGPVWVPGATAQDGFTGTDNTKVGAQTVAGRVGIVLIGSNGLVLDPQSRLVVEDGSDGMRVDERGNLYTTSGGTPGRFQITSPECTHLDEQRECLR
jgi:sugar lactone lactonase YvrE